MRLGSGCRLLLAVGIAVACLAVRDANAARPRVLPPQQVGGAADLMTPKQRGERIKEAENTFRSFTVALEAVVGGPREVYAIEQISDAEMAQFEDCRDTIKRLADRVISCYEPGISIINRLAGLAGHLQKIPLSKMPWTSMTRENYDLEEEKPSPLTGLADIRITQVDHETFLEKYFKLLNIAAEIRSAARTIRYLFFKVKEGKPKYDSVSRLMQNPAPIWEPSDKLAFKFQTMRMCALEILRDQSAAVARLDNLVAIWQGLPQSLWSPEAAPAVGAVIEESGGGFDARKAVLGKMRELDLEIMTVFHNTMMVVARQNRRRQEFQRDLGHKVNHDRLLEALYMGAIDRLGRYLEFVMRAFGSPPVEVQAESSWWPSLGWIVSSPAPPAELPAYRSCRQAMLATIAHAQHQLLTALQEHPIFPPGAPRRNVIVSDDFKVTDAMRLLPEKIARLTQQGERPTSDQVIVELRGLLGILSGLRSLRHTLEIPTLAALLVECIRAVVGLRQEDLKLELYTRLALVLLKCHLQDPEVANGGSTYAIPSLQMEERR